MRIKFKSCKILTCIYIFNQKIEKVRLEDFKGQNKDVKIFYTCISTIIKICVNLLQLLCE